VLVQVKASSGDSNIYLDFVYYIEPLAGLLPFVCWTHHHGTKNNGNEAGRMKGSSCSYSMGRIFLTVLSLLLSSSCLSLLNIHLVLESHIKISSDNLSLILFISFSRLSDNKEKERSIPKELIFSSCGGPSLLYLHPVLPLATITDLSCS
jgi:hypothetical protein